MCQLKAIENGAEYIDTAISSFAWGTSHPGTESMVGALMGEVLAEIPRVRHALGYPPLVMPTS